MLEYSFLTSATIVVAVMAALIYIKTRDVSYLVGIALMYYFSLLAGWFVIAERTSLDLSDSFANLGAVLYPIHLGETYDWTLILYTSFILGTETAILYAAPRAVVGAGAATAARWVSVPKILAIAAICGAASIVLVLIVTADVASETSLYVAHTQFENGIANVYSVLLFLGSVPSILCAVLCVTREEGRLLRCSASLTSSVACASLVLAMAAFRAVMGGKGVTLQALVFGVCLYCMNSPRPRYKTLAAISSVALILMGIMDQTRGMLPAEMLEAVVSSGGQIAAEGLYNLSGSGEKLAAHTSMYAVLDQGLPCTGGTSVVSLAASFVPGFIWPDRPEGIYEYYHRSLDLPDNQGFTIHHATGWYLNFGAWAVPVGGVVFGLVWSCLAQLSCRTRNALGASPLMRSMGVVGPFLFVSTVPPLMRNGMEGYKTLVMELALLAVVVRFGLLSDGPGGTSVKSTARQRERDSRAAASAVRRMDTASPMRRPAFNSRLGGRAGGSRARRSSSEGSP